MRQLITVPETAQQKDERLLRDRKATVEELLQNFSGAIYTAINAYRSSSMPFSVLELTGKKLALEAFASWTPGGMAPASYITTYVKQRLQRYVIQNQNTARLPEGQAQKAIAYHRATNELEQQMGRPPSSTEIASHMGVTMPQLTKVRRLIRSEGLQDDDFEALAHDPDFERASVAYYQLTRQEQQVFDYSMGAHGQQKLSTNDIAARLEVSAARVSTIKKRIAEKLEEYFG